MTPKEDLLEAMALVVYRRELDARTQALEEAARVVDGYNENPDWPDWPWTQCAAAIRLLKDKP